jgi:Plasmid recombination enzyme
MAVDKDKDHDNGSSCYFRAGTVNPLTKSSSTIKNAIAHNRRTTQAAYGARSNIDATHSHMNYCLEGDASPSAIVAKVIGGMIEHKARKNAPHAVEVLISLPANWSGDAKAVFMDSIPYLKEKLGADNFLSADVHLDEANPHMHVLFMPLEHCEKKGRLVWRSTLNKRTRELYDGFFSEVGAKHGLDRPIKLTPQMRSVLALAVIDIMNRSGDPAIKSKGWDANKMSIKANPKPYAVLFGINLKTLFMSKNSLGSFEVVKSEAKTKLPTCVWSSESMTLPIDRKTVNQRQSGFF